MSTTAPEDTTAASAERLPEPGQVIHALRSGINVMTTLGRSMFGSHSVTLKRGQTLTITADLLDANRDRHGSLATSVLGMIYDEPRQIERFGEVILRAGEPPADLREWIYGDPTWERMRDTARRRAHSLPSDQERREALAEVEREYGSAAATSKTTRTILPGQHPTEIQARAQQERHRAGIVDGSR